MTPNPQELFTPFLPSTFNIPEEEDRFKTFMGEKLSQFSDVINDKKIGTISQAAENFSGGTFWYKTTAKVRNEYQTLAYIPSLPNATTLTLTLTSNPQYPIANFTPGTVVTSVIGSASKPNTSVGAGDGDFFSFLCQGDSRISFTMSDDRIIITTTTDLRAYSSFLVINYIRDGL